MNDIRDDGGETRLTLPVMLLIIAALGAAVGLAAAALYLLLDVIQDVMLGGSESVQNPAGTSEPVRRVISILVASIIASAIWFVLRRHTHVPSVGKAVKGEKMPFVATCVHVVLQIVIVGSGLSIGRETAPRELGALFGQRLSTALKLTKQDMTIIVAVAAGAGFAGVYDAPLAGMFFAVEMLLADVSIRTVGLAFGTSAVAAYTAGLIKGHHAFYTIAPVEVTPELLLACVILGPVMGAVAYVFRRGTSWASKHQTTDARILWQLPLAGALTAAVAFVSPAIMGNGRALAQLSYNAADVSAIAPLLALAGAKALITMLTVRSGASGGVLTPAIAVGGALGAVIAILLPASLGLNVGVVALIASAAFLATSQKAPLMAACLMVELSHSPVNALVVAGIAVALSVLVAEKLETSRINTVISKVIRK
ncbi:chemotaxis protein CheV [Alloscardovia macacae]|uniref:Chemotaxis protein CheV n=1 Tax=Alloscardovia macacae TaxID=1160091 RepID=A0A1Y2SWC5_9BIFI|nr:chloride channel protein [Alloscardovia macacae]OTA27617.1 chemotaxis protein CheV [Alloscardovia macacae]OTA30263.1 chemotaxis protein CheV [Alloscardovia macacae]